MAASPRWPSAWPAERSPVHAGSGSLAGGERASGLYPGGMPEAGAPRLMGRTATGVGGAVRGGAGSPRVMPGTRGASAPAPQRRLRCQGRVRQRREQATGRSTWSPLGGSAVRQGAAAARARYRADGGPERCLAAQRCAGAVQRRRGISRRTDRSAGGCADRCPCSTTRAQACGGLDTAEASPRRRGRWRSRGRRWSGPFGPLDRTTLPLLAVGAAARSRRHRGPGWHKRFRPCARHGSALHMGTDPRRRGGCRAGKRTPRAGVSRRGLRPQEAEATRRPSTRPAHQRRERETTSTGGWATVLSGMLTHTTAGRAPRDRGRPASGRSSCGGAAG
jgi:hypothetical protein